MLDGGHVLLRQQGLGAFDAGVVIGKVEPAEIAERLIDEGLDLLRLGDVGAQEGPLAAGFADLRGHGLAARLVDIGDQYRRALGGQRPHRRLSNARAAAGHDRYALRQHHRCVLLIRASRQPAGSMTRSGGLCPSANV